MVTRTERPINPSWSRDIERRLVDLDKRTMVLEKSDAVVDALALERKQQLDSRFKHVDEKISDLSNKFDDRMQRLDKSIQSIKDALAKAIWLFAGAFIVAVAGFILKGGLSGLTP